MSSMNPKVLLGREFVQELETYAAKNMLHLYGALKKMPVKLEFPVVFLTGMLKASLPIFCVEVQD